MGRMPVDAMQRFQAKVKVDPATGCWLWTGAISPQGYGWFRLSEEHRGAAHRMAWLLFKGGEIEGGLHLDHQCHNFDRSCPGGRTCLHRRCVNVDHLIPATPWQNTHHAIWRDQPPPGYQKLIAREIAAFLDGQAPTAKRQGLREGIALAAQMIRDEHGIQE